MTKDSELSATMVATARVGVQRTTPVDAAQLRTRTERAGSVVMGRRLFDIVDSPHAILR